MNIDTQDEEWEEHMEYLEKDLFSSTALNEDLVHREEVFDKSRIHIYSGPNKANDTQVFEVYSVPCDVVIKKWEKSAKKGEVASKILLLVNSGKEPRAVIIKKPLTKRFKLKAPLGIVSPWSVILQPDETLVYTIEFVPPQKGIDEEALLWDNYQDVVACYTQQYPVFIPLRAVKGNAEVNSLSIETFHPSAESLKHNPPTMNMFQLITQQQNEKKKIAKENEINHTKSETKSESIQKTVSPIQISPEPKTKTIVSDIQPKSIIVKPIINQQDQAPKNVNVDTKFAASAIITSLRARRSTLQSMGLNANEITTQTTSSILNFQQTAINCKIGEERLKKNIALLQESNPETNNELTVHYSPRIVTSNIKPFRVVTNIVKKKVEKEEEEENEEEEDEYNMEEDEERVRNYDERKDYDSDNNDEETKETKICPPSKEELDFYKQLMKKK